MGARKDHRDCRHYHVISDMTAADLLYFDMDVT